MDEQPITVPCKIYFDRDNREESTIRFLFEDIPFVLNFRELYNFGILLNGNDKLSLANLYVNDDRTICSLLDIRIYSQFGIFAPPNDRREVPRRDQDGYEDNHTRTQRIIDEITRASETLFVTPAFWGPLKLDDITRASETLFVAPAFGGTLKLAVTLTNFIYIITKSDAVLDHDELKRVYPEPYDDYYNKNQRTNPENIIFQIVQKLYQKFPESFDTVRFRRQSVGVGGKKKNGRRSCRTRYKAKHAKHSKSKKRYRKSKKRMLRS
jgi:hypothetical protein